MLVEPWKISVPRGTTGLILSFPLNFPHMAIALPDGIIMSQAIGSLGVGPYEVGGNVPDVKFSRLDQGDNDDTSIVLQEMDRGGPWVSGGFAQKDTSDAAYNEYQFGVPNACLADVEGVEQCNIFFYDTDPDVTGDQRRLILWIQIDLTNEPVTAETIQGIVFGEDVQHGTYDAGTSGGVFKKLYLAPADAQGYFKANVYKWLDSAPLTYALKKNTAFTAFKFYLQTTAGEAAIGKTVTATRCIDGGSFASCANAVSEIAGGWYKINLAAADLNGDDIAFNFAAAGCKTTPVKVITQG